MARVATFSRRWGVVAIVAALLVSSIGIGATPVSAQDDPQESVTLAPSSKKYQLSAGEKKSDYITVLNDGQTEYDFTVYTTPYWVKDSSYQPDFATKNERSDAFGWISFEKTTYHLASRESKEIPYTIMVPEHATPGGHYGIIFVEVQPPANANANLARKKRVGSIVYASVKGDEQLAGQTIGMNTPLVQPMAPLQSFVEVQNTGNTNFTASTVLKVSDLFGSVKAEIKNDYEVLPGTTRDITLQWANSPWFGLYKVDTSSSVLGKTLSSTAYVLIMPFWMVLLFIAVLAGAVVYYVLRLKKHASAQKQEK